jgi:hypothetical protein
MIEAETRILGGLPVRVIGRIHPAEPDVGAAESAEIDDIEWLSGRSVPDSIWKRLSRKDEDTLHDALLGAQTDAAADRADYLYEQYRDRLLDAQINAERWR